MTNRNNSITSSIKWSGLETPGMKDAKCSLLLQDDIVYDCKIKTLPKQRVLVYQDKSFHPNSNNNTLSSGAANHNNNKNTTGANSDDNFHVDFPGATILQLEPSTSQQQQQQGNSSNASTMPVTLTVGGRCLFTPENYQDFSVMMRTKQQSMDMHIAPNGTFDWPDVESLLLCPVCGERCPVPTSNTSNDTNTNNDDNNDQEYWMLFYPLLQITVVKGSQMTLGTRTICRLTCLECMEDLLEGMTLTVQPGSSSGGRSSTNQLATAILPTGNTTDQTAGTAAAPPAPTRVSRTRRLAFTLPASDVLAEAGSASFLEDGPPRPDTHPHVDDILDGWTLYNLWEHSGAWEALQNEYRTTLSKSMHADAASAANGDQHDANNHDADAVSAASEPRLKERMGKRCGNPGCTKVHGRPDLAAGVGEIVRLGIKCRECHSEFYCSKACREASKQSHQEDCSRKRKEREDRREKKAKKVECDTCHKKHPYTRMKKCSRCRSATYCSIQCQKDDWENHKEACQKIVNETR
ncbi:hypothetical protein MPSEU_000939000 [Mayamaea pseudoterrestris]|nr:hypothetical protein MPSEU_000939000 [Mayamaea pseudoterrestris]